MDSSRGETPRPQAMHTGRPQRGALMALRMLSSKGVMGVLEACRQIRPNL
jgi:hypothetical protein